MNLMLPKEDRSAMLLRLYNATDPIINHSKDAQPKSNHSNGAEATLIKAETESDGDTKLPEDVEVEQDIEMKDVDVKDEEGGLPIDTAASNELDQ